MNMCGYQVVAIYDDEIDAISAGNQKRRNMSFLWLPADAHIDLDAFHFFRSIALCRLRSPSLPRMFAVHFIALELFSASIFY